MESLSNRSFEAYFDDLMLYSKRMSEKYLDDVLNLITTVICNVTDSKVCAIRLVDDIVLPPELRLKLLHAPVHFPPKKDLATLDDAVANLIVHQKKTVFISDIAKAARFEEKALARLLGLVSMLGLPLTDTAGSVIGVLTCFTAVPTGFSESAIGLIEIVARHAATAILNTEQLVKTRVAQEELGTRALISRAKASLMHRYHLGEEAAHGWFQKICLTSLKSPRSVAEDILLIPDRSTNHSASR